MSIFRILSTTVLSLTFATAAYAETAAPLTKVDVQAIVKETLINDPEIIMNALEKLRQQKAEDAKKEGRAAIDKNKAELFADANSPSIGPANADVTVVEFYDYHCGYCKHFLGDLTKLVSADKNVRVVFKDFPILSEDSVTAARAAIAVNRIAPKKFFDYHTALMAEKGKFDEARLLEIAKSNGIDSAKLKAEMAKPEITAMLDTNRRIAGELGIRGTPGLVIGNEVIGGAASLEELQELVAKARAANSKK